MENAIIKSRNYKKTGKFSIKQIHIGLILIEDVSV